MLRPLAAALSLALLAPLAHASSWSLVSVVETPANDPRRPAPAQGHAGRRQHQSLRLLLRPGVRPEDGRVVRAGRPRSRRRPDRLRHARRAPAASPSTPHRRHRPAGDREDHAVHGRGRPAVQRPEPAAAQRRQVRARRQLRSRGPGHRQRRALLRRRRIRPERLRIHFERPVHPCPDHAGKPQGGRCQRRVQLCRRPPDHRPWPPGQSRLRRPDLQRLRRQALCGDAGSAGRRGQQQRRPPQPQRARGRIRRRQRPVDGAVRLPARRAARSSTRSTAAADSTSRPPTRAAASA